MSARRTARRRTAWRKVSPDLAKVGELLRAAGYALSEANPIAAAGYFDADGRCRRVSARYADGWSALLNIGTNGRSSLSYSIKLGGRVTGELT